MSLDNIPQNFASVPERLDSLYYKNIGSTVTPPQQQHDHIPVPMEDVGYTSGLANNSDTFRKRNSGYSRNNKLHSDSEDFDLDLATHHKSDKLKWRKAASKQLSRKRDWYIVLFLTIWAAYIRMYKLHQPPSVVFDEVHFGGFATKYIKTRFFMDVHPPLAKMMIALVGKLAGLDGFDFKDIGKDYTADNVPYVFMRGFCALMGLLVVPIAYLTVRGAGHSIAAGLVAALMICYENGLITNNRLILLDPPLLFFTAATILMWINFHNQKNKPFQFWWYVWLMLTGVGLGLTVSCKWVGLFTIATIGSSTVKGLWEIWGDTRTPMIVFLKHFGARAVALIFVPISIYMLMFQIHFHSLPNSGEGDGFMSPEFQQTLDGHASVTSPIDIAYGSRVYIRHVATTGGYLHSHPHRYISGSKQQQVTLYPHRDNNNWWTIHKVNDADPEGIEYVKDGDIITLKHADSEMRLHSHDMRPPITDLDYHYEVSAYGGFPNFTGDSNDQWRVEIIEGDKADPESSQRLRTIHTKFALVHVLQRCSLFSHNVKLPEWGFGQQEVTCIKNGKIKKTVWYVENTENPLLPEDTEKVSYNRLGFLGKFLELNKVMWNTNKGLTSSHPYDSRPESWPLLRRGINFWSKDKLHIYLLGNPLVFWCASISVLVYIILKGAFIILEKRGIKKQFGDLKKFYDESAGFFFAGWFFHYFPFFLMGRQLFLHHYMPALYFSILLFSVGFDLLTIRLVNRKRLVAAGVFILGVIHVYRYFIPITYGEPWTQSLCEKAKWRSTWDFDCASYHIDYESYNTRKPLYVEGFYKVKEVFNNYLGREQEAKVVEGVNLVSDKIDIPPIDISASWDSDLPLEATQ